LICRHGKENGHAKEKVHRDDSGRRPGNAAGGSDETIAKPAVPFGGKYRIIDFPLSNCSNSGIDTVGILTQYQPFFLHSYVGIGSPGISTARMAACFSCHPIPTMLAESGTRDGGRYFSERRLYRPVRSGVVVILSGDHIYRWIITRCWSITRPGSRCDAGGD
jgi:glucose-1-phosphate adenylyltransferase